MNAQMQPSKRLPLLILLAGKMLQNWAIEERFGIYSARDSCSSSNPMVQTIFDLTNVWCIDSDQTPKNFKLVNNAQILLYLASLLVAATPVWENNGILSSAPDREVEIIGPGWY